MREKPEDLPEPWKIMNCKDFGHVSPAINRKQKVSILGKLWTMEPFIVEKHPFHLDTPSTLKSKYSEIIKDYKKDRRKLKK